MKKLRILIVALNSKYIHSSLAPWCLKAGIEKYGSPNIQTIIEEGTVNEREDAILSRIIAHNPDVVGLSTYIWNITAMRALIPKIKRALPNSIIILGGPEVSYNPAQVLSENLGADYVLCGEGEKSLALLLTAILENTVIKGIAGVCGREFEAPPCIEADEGITPYTAEYFSKLGGRIVYLETSRGCPFSCAFCLSGQCGGVRYFDLARVKKEIILLAGSGTQTIKLVDRTFNANPKRAGEIITFILENYGKNIPDSVCFHFEIAGDILTDDLILLLAKASKGAIQLEIGMQSFNATALEAVNRKTNMKKLSENIKKLLADGNLHVHLDLIAGLPQEDMQSFINSFNIGYSFKPHMLQLGFLKILKGSPMGENPQQFPCEYRKTPPYEIISTPWICENELNELRRVEDAVDRLYNSGRFPRTLEFVLSETSMTPYELFLAVANFTGSSAGATLDKYTEKVWNCFSAMVRVDLLHDNMVKDRLATNSSGKLPTILRKDGESMGRLLLDLDRINKRWAGVKRAAAQLYASSEVVYVDYDVKDKVTGEYPISNSK